MRRGGRRVVSLVAIYAIALHTILSGAGLAASAATVDPLLVVCHSDTAAPGEQAPDVPAPTRACDHCTLCIAVAAPAPTSAATIARLLPPRVLALLRPAQTAAPDALTDNPNRTRGPPKFA